MEWRRQRQQKQKRQTSQIKRREHSTVLAAAGRAVAVGSKIETVPISCLVTHTLFRSLPPARRLAEMRGRYNSVLTSLVVLWYNGSTGVVPNKGCMLKST